MQTLLRIMVMRATLLLRMLARPFGYQLKMLGKRLSAFGEGERGHAWGVPSLRRMALCELEIVGPYPRVSRGPLYAAGFRAAPDSARRVVVLRLNWVATRNAPFGEFIDGEWSFQGECDMLIDPARSPLHELPDGTFWFMWPDGSYGVIRSDPARRLSFAGDPETPRVYQYF